MVKLAGASPNTLGVFLRRNENLEMSHTYFLRAAYFGHLNSQYNVATDFYNGDGVEQNNIPAFAWATMTSIEGDKDGEKLVEMILPSLSEEDFKLGEDLIASLREKVLN